MSCALAPRIWVHCVRSLVGVAALAGCTDPVLPDAGDAGGGAVTIPQSLGCDGSRADSMGLCREDQVCDRSSGACVNACAGRCGLLEIPSLQMDGPASLALDCGGCADGATCQADNVCRAPTACGGLEINGLCCTGTFSFTALPAPPTDLTIHSLHAHDGNLLVDYSNDTGAGQHIYRLFRYGHGGADLTHVREESRVFTLDDTSPVSLGSRGLGLGSGEMLELVAMESTGARFPYELRRTAIEGGAVSPATYRFEASSAWLYNPRLEYRHPSFFEPDSSPFDVRSFVYRDDGTLFGGDGDGRAGANGSYFILENDFAWCGTREAGDISFACERAFWYTRPTPSSGVRDEAIAIVQGPSAAGASAVLVGRYLLVATTPYASPVYEPESQLLVVDLADPANPIVAATYDSASDQRIRIGGLVREGLPWVILQEASKRTLGLVDLSDPGHPAIVPVTSFEPAEAIGLSTSFTQAVVDSDRHVAFIASWSDSAPGVVLGLPTCTSR